VRQNFISLIRIREILCFAVIAAVLIATVMPVSGQEKFPPPPSDTTKIYLIDIAGDLHALPVESGRSSLSTESVATRDKKGYIELAGGTAATAVDQPLPRIYLFIPSGPDAHPAFLVHFDLDRGHRRVPILAQKGLAGYAVPTDHIVIPHYRVLGTVGDLQFMEITPRQPLGAGEYAVLGADLQQIATFRVT
jgi:hypothetical protein